MTQSRDLAVRQAVDVVLYRLDDHALAVLALLGEARLGSKALQPAVFPIVLADGVFRGDGLGRGRRFRYATGALARLLDVFALAPAAVLCCVPLVLGRLGLSGGSLVPFCPPGRLAGLSAGFLARATLFLRSSAFPDKMLCEGGRVRPAVVRVRPIEGLDLGILALDLGPEDAVLGGDGGEEEERGAKGRGAGTQRRQEEDPRPAPRKYVYGLMATAGRRLVRVRISPSRSAADILHTYRRYRGKPFGSDQYSGQEKSELKQYNVLHIDRRAATCAGAAYDLLLRAGRIDRRMLHEFMLAADSWVRRALDTAMSASDDPAAASRRIRSAVLPAAPASTILPPRRRRRQGPTTASRSRSSGRCPTCSPR